MRDAGIDDDMKRVLVWVENQNLLYEAVDRVPGVQSVPVTGKREAIQALKDADAFVTSAVLWDSDLSAALSESPRLHWIQLLNAGADNVLDAGVPEGVSISTIGSVGGELVAEHAMTLLLCLLRSLPFTLAAQTRRVWAFRETVASMRSLSEQNLAVVGYGPIGRRIAELASQFGARVTAVSRSARQRDEVCEVFDYGRLHEVLRTAEAIVVAVPLTASTRRMIDEGAFAAMKRGSYLVNVSRGSVVDTDALVAALESNQLAGVALDVCDPEPLPPEHVLWTHPGVIITPHVAWAGSAGAREAKLMALVEENVRRFASGEQLLHVLDAGADGGRL